MTDHSRFGICAAAAVPHAPQMLSLPASEDAAQVARVRETMHRLGAAMRAQEPMERSRGIVVVGVAVAVIAVIVAVLLLTR